MGDFLKTAEVRQVGANDKGHELYIYFRLKFSFPPAQLPGQKTTTVRSPVCEHPQTLAIQHSYLLLRKDLTTRQLTDDDHGTRNGRCLNGPDLCSEPSGLRV